MGQDTKQVCHLLAFPLPPAHIPVYYYSPFKVPLQGEARNILELDPRLRRRAEPARHTSVDGPLSRVKQARLVARSDPQPVGLSKWASTESQRICALYGTRIHARLYIFALTSQSEPAQCVSAWARTEVYSLLNIIKFFLSPPPIIITHLFSTYHWYR